MRFTSLAGTGGRLLANIRGEGLADCLQGWVLGCMLMAMLHVGATTDPAEAAVLPDMWRSEGGPNE